VGELKGILSLVEHRKITSDFEQVHARSVWETRKNCNICHSRFRQNYFEVFEKERPPHRMSSTLPVGGRRFSGVYVFMKGAAEDLKTMEEGSPLAWGF